MNDLVLFFEAFWFPILIAVFLLLFWLACKIENSKPEICPFCGGSGKQWANVHDSQDLQTVNCEYCQGTGKKPKKEEKKNGN